MAVFFTLVVCVLFLIYAAFEFLAKIYPVIFAVILILGIIFGIIMLLRGNIIQFLLHIPLTGLFIHIMQKGGNALIFRTDKDGVGAFGDMIGYCIGNSFNLLFLGLVVIVYLGLAGTMADF